VSEPADRVRSFLLEEAYWDGPASELTDDVMLIATHVIDSMLLLRLVAWLEGEYEILINDADVVPSNFESIHKISELVSTKLAASGS
jgi:acyl carrier protein